MENIIYNELVMRGFNVDVGTIEHVVRDEAANALPNIWKWILFATKEASVIIFSQRSQFLMPKRWRKSKHRLTV